MRQLGRVALTLGIGAADGAVFAWFEMPLAWMIGAMIATIAASLSGLPLHVYGPLRLVMVSVLGLMLGSAFTPAIVDQLNLWAVTLGGLAVYVGVTTALVMVYHAKVAKFGPVTSYFAAAPGGLTEMVLTGAAMGGDERRISLIHGLRIVFIVMTVPFAFRFVTGYETGEAGARLGSIFDLSAFDAIEMAVSAAVGALLGRWLRFPAWALTGPLTISAAIHIAGLTQSHPPGELVAVAQIVLGASLGSRFNGISLRDIRQTAVIAIGSTALMLICSLIAAFLLNEATGLSLLALILAFVPGGLAEMTLIALSLGQDVAFVSTHHFARILIVILAAAPAFALLRRFWPGLPEEKGDRGFRGQ